MRLTWETEPDGQEDTGGFVVDKYTFKENWKFNSNSHTAGVEFQYKDYVYISAGEYLNINSRNHLIYCLDLKTGSVKWRFDAGVGVILLNIELFEGKVFLKSLEDKVIWLDALTGKQLENFTASNIPETKRNHTFNGNKAVAIAGDGQAGKAARIVCKNAEGITLWTYVVKPLLKVKEPYAVNFSFLIGGKNLILATYDGKVRSFTIN